MMNINNYLGDLADISAKTKSRTARDWPNRMHGTFLDATSSLTPPQR